MNVNNVLRRTPVSNKEYFGDMCQEKLDYILRFGFNNICGFGHFKDTVKSRKIISMIHDLNFDIFGLAETNIYWDMIPIEHRIQERTFGYWSNTATIAACNTTGEWNNWEQPGGTAVISTEQAAYRCCGRGKDPSGLGRWCWMRYRGKKGTHVRFFSAYQANRLTRDGDTTAARQQKHYYNEKFMEDADIWKNFVEELANDVEEAINAGDQVVIGIDTNDNIITSPLTAKMTELGLIQPILE